MKLLDTNVFVYARGRPDRYKAPCQAILAIAETDPGSYGIDVETLQELLDLYVRRGERQEAVRTVEDALAAFSDPIPITRAEIEEAADVISANPRLSPRDAIHVAVCRTFELEGIVSADKAFDRVSDLVRFDPLKLAGP